MFKVGDSGASIYESLRVRTSSGTGFVPLIDPADATYDELRVHTSSHGTLAVHDSAASIQVSTTSTTGGENVTLTVYEDSTGDGTVDNEESFALSGGTENLSPGSLSLAAGNTLWYHLEAEDSDVTNAAEIDSISLVGENTSTEWSTRDDFAQGQSSSGMTYDAMGDNSKDKIQHGYKHGSVTEGLVAYYPMENSGSAVLRDAALNNTGQINGATWNGSGKVGNYSLNFDGSDDAVRTNYNGIGAADQSFTAMCWHKGSSTSLSSNYPFITNYVDGGHNGFWWIATTDGSTVEIRLRDNSTNNDSQSSDYSTAYDGSWHHYALIRNAASSEAKFYIDGQLKETINFPGSNPCRDSDSFFGMMEHVDSNHTPGDLDEVRLYDRALSKPEIEAVYNRTSPNGHEITSNDVPGNTDGGISRYEFENDVTDSWGTNDGTDNTSAGYVNGVYGQAKDFDGSDDYVDVANVGAIENNSELTISAWVNLSGTTNSNSSTNMPIYVFGSGWDNYVFLDYGTDGNNDNPNRFIFNIDTGENLGLVSSSQHTETGVWFHVVGTWTKSGGGKIYVNGSLEGSAQSATTNTPSGVDHEIGRVNWATSNVWNGNIDDIRVYDRALKPEEVEKLFHLGAHRINRGDVV